MSSWFVSPLHWISLNPMDLRMTWPASSRKPIASKPWSARPKLQLPAAVQPSQRDGPRNEAISGSINNHLQTARLVILKAKSKVEHAGTHPLGMPGFGSWFFDIFDVLNWFDVVESFDLHSCCWDCSLKSLQERAVIEGLRFQTFPIPHESTSLIVLNSFGWLFPQAKWALNARLTARLKCRLAC